MKNDQIDQGEQEKGDADSANELKDEFLPQRCGNHQVVNCTFLVAKSRKCVARIENAKDRHKRIEETLKVFQVVRLVVIANLRNGQYNKDHTDVRNGGKNKKVPVVDEVLPEKERKPFRAEDII